MTAIMSEPQFALGQVVATHGAAEALDGDLGLVLGLLDRHSRKDWGDVCAEDALANEEALIIGARLLSAYDGIGPQRVTLWIITECDRSATTVLLPCEY